MAEKKDDLAHAEKVLGEPAKTLAPEATIETVKESASTDSQPSESSKASGEESDSKKRAPTSKEPGESLSEQAKILARAIFGGDSPSRWMAVLFWLSFAALLVTLGLGILSLTGGKSKDSQTPEVTHEAEDSHRADEHSDKHSIGASAESEVKASDAQGPYYLDLGKFTLELVSNSPSKNSGEIADLAELQFVIECDTLETKQFLEQRLIQVKSIISEQLTPKKREDLLSFEGKQNLKIIIMEKLNAWIPKGKVLLVLITDLVAS